MFNTSALRRSFYTARLAQAMAATVAFVSLSASLAVAGQHSDGRLFLTMLHVWCEPQRVPFLQRM